MAEPPLRQITTWQEAELNARDWMRMRGFPDAQLTAPGADAGIDVWCRSAIAQVKYEARDVGRPQLQRLVGARGRRECQLLFFTGSSYSQQALVYADEMGIALFQYAVDGRMRPVNKAAVSISLFRASAADQDGRSDSALTSRRIGIGLVISSLVLAVALGSSLVPIVLFFTGIALILRSFGA